MIIEPDDPNRASPVAESSHEQTDDELSDKELKQMEVDDQAIQIILMGLPEDIYASLDSCDTAQDIWLRVQQMMKGSDIGAQEKKAKANSGNQFRQYARQNVGKQIRYNEGRSQGIITAVRATGNDNGNNGNHIRCYNCRGVDHYARNYIMVDAAENEKIEEVNANCILMANLQQSSTSGTHAEKAPIQMDHLSNVILIDSIMEHSGGIVEQHPDTIEETRAFYESLYNNMVIEVYYMIRTNTNKIISHAPTIPITLHDVDELQQPQQQRVQQQGDQPRLQSKADADNVNNAIFDEDIFINPFVPPSTSSAESSSKYVDPLNMRTFYQPYQHEYQWTKDHPLEKVVGEPSRPLLI
nr:hypothetical protein [Tanacetum cinerariifolium]